MYYVLDEAGVPVLEPSVMAWARWFEDASARGAEGRRVGYTDINDETYVSTVFLGVDHRFMGEGRPLLFETMVFGGAYDEYQWRYSTRDEALRGHVAVVEALMLGREPQA
jgi:hypothetical protein